MLVAIILLIMIEAIPVYRSPHPAPESQP